MENSKIKYIFAAFNQLNDMKEKKSKTHIGEDTGCMTACEPALATADVMETPLPDDMDYAHIVNGVLQITPDIEDEMAAVDRGEVVSMGEFKTMFARWLD